MTAIGRWLSQFLCSGTKAGDVQYRFRERVPLQNEADKVFTIDARFVGDFCWDTNITSKYMSKDKNLSDNVSSEMIKTASKHMAKKARAFEERHAVRNMNRHLKKTRGAFNAIDFIEAQDREKEQERRAIKFADDKIKL